MLVFYERSPGSSMVQPGLSTSTVLIMQSLTDCGKEFRLLLKDSGKPYTSLGWGVA